MSLSANRRAIEVRFRSCDAPYNWRRGSCFSQPPRDQYQHFQPFGPRYETPAAHNYLQTMVEQTKSKARAARKRGIEAVTEPRPLGSGGLAGFFSSLLG